MYAAFIQHVLTKQRLSDGGLANGQQCSRVCVVNFNLMFWWSQFILFAQIFICQMLKHAGFQRRRITRALKLAEKILKIGKL